MPKCKVQDREIKYKVQVVVAHASANHIVQSCNFYKAKEPCSFVYLADPQVTRAIHNYFVFETLRESH
jgi:hypothetical protein